MVAPSPGSLLRQASGWAIFWGVLLILFGVLAVGSPPPCGRHGERSHRVAHHSRRYHPPGGSVSRARRGQHDLESAGGPRLPLHRGISVDAPAPRGRVADAAAGLSLLHRGSAGRPALFQSSSCAGSGLGFVRRHRDFALGIIYWYSLAIELGLGDWHAGRREHDHQWSGASDDVIGGAETNQNREASQGRITAHGAPSLAAFEFNLKARSESATRR
jgi:hypothetical protein